MRRVGLLSAIALLVLHLSAVALFSSRPMHYDENEYLHASWLMAAGKQLYVDFFEDHPAHLFQFVGLLRPAADELSAVNVKLWAVRARWAAGIFGAAATVAVMLFAWRASRSPAAAVVAGAVMLAGAQMWTRGLADARLEPFTLAFFWIGALLIAWSDEVSAGGAIRHGLGIGFIVLADAWNPKWPLESLVLLVAFAIFVVRAFRREIRAAIVAIALPLLFGGVAVVQILAASSFGNYLFFNFELKSGVYSAFKTFDWMQLHFAKYPFASTMDAHVRPRLMIAALIVTTIALVVPRIRRRMDVEMRPAMLGVLLLATSLVEIRFVYPYPLLWAQYLVMAVCGAAVTYALVPNALAALLPAAKPVIAWASLVVALAGGSSMLVKLNLAARRSAPGWDLYWARLEHLREHVRSGESVWISPPRHPVAVVDASYYWYSFREAVPYAMAYARTHPDSPLPRVGPHDLPPCAPRDDLRFIEFSSWATYLDACVCAETLVKERRVLPSPHFGIFEMTHRAPSTLAKSPVPRWYAQSVATWPSLCAWRGFAGTDAEFEARARGLLK